MKTEIVNQRVLRADAGMMLTNGSVCVTTVVMPMSADASVWTEIPEAEAKEIIEKKEAEADV